MKHICLVLLAVVCVVGLSMLVLKFTRRQPEAGGTASMKPEQTKTTPVVRTASDQALLDAVLDSPEQMDAPVVRAAETAAASPVSAVPVCRLPTGRQRQLLSDVKKPSAPQPLKEPVAADTLHFREDYASLRTDAVRNPDSPENRQGVVSLMQARQRRFGQTN